MAQQGVLTNLDGLVFNKGYMYGTRSGGATNAIQFGALQNVKVTHTLQKVEVEGPESLSPLGVGIKGETVSGTFGFAVITPEQYFMALGGGLSYDGGADRTSYTKLVNEEPKPYDLYCKSENDPSPGLDVTFYRCVTDSWNLISADNRAWMMGDGGFRCYGEANSGRLYVISKAGSLINAS